jgi:hypothetical protein
MLSVPHASDNGACVCRTPVCVPCVAHVCVCVLPVASIACVLPVSVTIICAYPVSVCRVPTLCSCARVPCAVFRVPCGTCAYLVWRVPCAVWRVPCAVCVWRVPTWCGVCLVPPLPSLPLSGACLPL